MAISILATVIRHSFGGWAVRPVQRKCGSQESTNASGDRWPHLSVCPVFRYQEWDVSDLSLENDPRHTHPGTPE